SARFRGPLGLAVDSSGNLFIGDTNNQTIRKGGLTAAPSIGTQPGNQSVPIGGTATFSVAASGNPTPFYQWQRQAGGVGAFSDLSDTDPYSGAATATLTITG